MWVCVLCECVRVCAYLSIYVYEDIFRTGNRRIHMFGVIANNFDQLIRNIFGSLRMIFGRLRIIFQMDSQKDVFFFTPFLNKFYA